MIAGECMPAITSRFIERDTVQRLQHSPVALAAATYAYNAIPNEVRVDAVAAFVGMHRASFSRFFARRVGITFVQFLQALRIERAVVELERHDCPVSALADAAGYGRVSSFCRTFKAVTGTTPSDYRRRRLLNLGSGP